MITTMLPVLMFAAPLGTDSAAVCVALSAREKFLWRRRLLVAAVLTAFEAATPGIGMALSGPVGDAIGSVAHWIAAGLLVALGLWMLRSAPSEHESTEPDVTGWTALLATGVAVSIDEIAVGMSLGMAGVPLIPLVATVAVWVFTATTLGLCIGERLGENFGDVAGRVAACALIVLGALIGFGVL